MIARRPKAPCSVLELGEAAKRDVQGVLDATIVRAVLLPASMKLLGDWNWYLPSWLQWLPRLESTSEPAPELDSAPASA